MQLVFATHNAHKTEEVRAILESTPYRVESLADLNIHEEIPETGDTFRANALQKAMYLYERLQRPIIADDSGLEVDSLGGAPGVYSKRFSPEATTEHNNALLLSRLQGLSERTARFRCVVAVVGLGDPFTVAGACEGRIATELRGDGGFGYDPLFLPDAIPGRSLAECSPDEKNAISHRGYAFRALAQALSGTTT